MPSSRRRFLGLLGGVGGAGLAGCTTVDVGNDGPATETETGTPAGPHSWPMFQNDHRNTGHADATGPTESVTELWRSRPNTTISAPVVADGTVYVHTGNDRTVYALAAADGTEQWSFQRGWNQVRDIYYPRTMPAVVDDTVYAVSNAGENSDSAGTSTLYALAAADGTERWNFSPATSAPSVVDDTIYVAGGYTVYALAADDGTEQWRYRPASDVGSWLAVADDTVYVASGDGTVYALSTADGSQQWRYETESDTTSTPTVVDGTVYVGTGTTYDHVETRETSDTHYVLALAAADGSERWRYELDGKVHASPAVADDTVYVGRVPVYDGSADPAVYALAAADGSERWTFSREEYTENPSFLMGTPAVADDAIYVGSGDIVYALTAADGSERWTFRIDGYVQSSPAVVDDTVYVSSDRTVYALTGADDTDR